MNAYSYTKIKTFLDCPKRYEYTFIQERETVPSDLALQGITEHQIIKEGKIPEFFQPVFEKHFVNPVFERKIEKEFLTFKLEGIPDVYSINEPLSLCYIADWKLFNIPDDDMQLKIYALLLSYEPVQIDTFICYYVSLKGEFFKRFTFYKDNIQKFENELTEIIEKIENAKEFYPRPGSHCALCPFIKDCYIENQLTKLEVTTAIQSIEEAKKLAKKVLIAENFLKQVKEQIKKFMLETGIDDLQIDDENRLYLSSTITMRWGKVKKNKNKKFN